MENNYTYESISWDNHKLSVLIMVLLGLGTSLMN
jgi:hypothetical protein